MDTQTENNETNLGRILERLASEIYIIDADTLKFLFVNQQVRENVGYTEEEFHELTPLDIKTEFTSESFAKLTAPLRANQKNIIQFETMHLRKDGTYYPVDVHMQMLPYQGKLSYVATIFDVTERKQMETQLVHLATHDPLTGLYNRSVMEQRLNDEINRSSRYNHPVSIFMLDIDYYKSINDTYGHRTGDNILQQFANELKASTRNSDYAARYGGEEFIIILPETSLAEAEELAERLRKHIAEFRFTVDDERSLELTISIGIATYPEHAQTSHELMRVADMAMYKAKDAGRNKVKTP